MPDSPSRRRSGNAVAMKRESSLESSDVSESRTRVTKKLKITVPNHHVNTNTTRIARVYISRHDIRSESKSVSPGATSTPKSKASRGEGRFQSSNVSPSVVRRISSSSPPASDELALSGDEADDEIDTQSERSRCSSRAPPDVDNDSDARTEVDEDEDETRHVEMSIVQHVAPSSPLSSLPATPTSFPSLPSFPRFGTTVPGVPASAHLVEIEDMVLLTPRQGTPWVNSSSSDNSSDDRELCIPGRQRKRKRKAPAAIREDSVSGIEEAMPLVSTSSAAEETVARRLFRGSQGFRPMGKSLLATVSGVTAGLQALPPLHRYRTLLETGSDIEMGFLQGSNDNEGSETDTDMKDVEIHTQLSPDPITYFDEEPFMTLDQFTAYRSNRINTLNNPRLPHHELVDRSTLRGQNIQIYLSKLGYTLPIPLGRAVARHKRSLGKPLPRQYKPITRLTGNLREDLLVRLFSKYRREVIKGHNKSMCVTTEQAAQILATWQGIHFVEGFGQRKNTGDVVVVAAEETSSPAGTVTPVDSAPASPVAPTNPTSTVVAVKAFARTYADRLEPYEAIYPEAAARYTRALLCMINDRFPAWDRWWSDERLYALHRSEWGLYDAETARIEREAREVQDAMVRRRHARARNARMERLGFGGAAVREGMATRMDRDEAELIERTVLEARIQQFRSLVNAPPVASLRPASIIDVQAGVSEQGIAVVPASPPPSYNGSPPRSPTSRSVVRSAWSTPRAIVSAATSLIAQVAESPPRLPSYQPNTYRRGISPPPPPPFNARTDAMPVSHLSCALEQSSSESLVVRRIEFDESADESDNVRLPGGFSSRRQADRVSHQLAPAIVLSRPEMIPERILDVVRPAAQVVELHSHDAQGDESEQEEVEELDDLLEEVEEEDVEEQEQGDRGRERVRSGCVLM
ncbi:hypothetical protein QFC21_004176 [Naganishia friedmannii]|uniref:Uncharacterized protein n=1 Tax=Naganishia friedmannii TaxID=89922 RepID=A0ACC2VIR9_9TREE|nr:hypothetical protein QFC21_004176 [Naganishia friedmannii]